MNAKKDPEMIFDADYGWLHKDAQSSIHELERENARLIRDMVLHERALEKSMEREERLRELLDSAVDCIKKQSSGGGTPRDAWEWEKANLSNVPDDQLPLASGARPAQAGCVTEVPKGW